MRSGMRGFLVVWIGQVVSLLGTGMTNFALTIWAFETTGKATSLALIGAFYAGALLVVSPFAGVIVDRFDRKRVMMVSDSASGLVTVTVFLLYSSGSLVLWHLYGAALVMGAFQSMQWPATSAVITVMLPKSQYTRANSLMGLAGPSSQVVAPLAAGALLGMIGLRGVLLIDMLTFLVAVGTLALVTIPRPPESFDTSTLTLRSALSELSFGFRYIWRRRSLLLLQTLFMLGNFLYTIAFTMFAPMILLRTGNNELLLGSVQTIGALGGVAGGMLVGMWGGFRRRIRGVVLGWSIVMVTLVVQGLGRGEPVWAGVPVWGAGAFVGALASVLIDSSNQAIWQSKVPPALQGRVFSIRQLIAMGIVPLASLIAGPLADQVLEPAMRSGGRWSAVFGWLVGNAPGAGMALAFIAAGLLGGIVVLVMALNPLVREVETLLPDHDGQLPALATD